MHIIILLILSFFFISDTLSAAYVGNGFYYHGIAAPISQSRGFVSTMDGSGKNVVFVWLNDFRGGYGLLKIDASTGETEEYPTPFSFHRDSPFASILSNQNRYYAHFGSHFVEFDITRKAFTFVGKTSDKTSMSMTEDDKGVIWSVTYPDSGLVSYDPKNQKFIDYGTIYKQGWRQYPRYIASDDKGWIYFAIGNTASQIIAFNPRTKEVIPVIPEIERKRGMAYVHRDKNGKVYGKALKNEKRRWFELHGGQIKKFGPSLTVNEKKYVAGTQGLNHRHFPDGQYVKTLDLQEKKLVIQKKTGAVETLDFDYASQGALIMSVGITPENCIFGGTTHPKFSFEYDPEIDQLNSQPCLGQWNTITSQGGQIYIGAYPKGLLMEWNPSRDWIPTKKDTLESNPFLIHESASDLDRPHTILAHDDGKTIIMAGTPGYGYTGGGQLFWDRKSKNLQLLNHQKIIPNHSTRSLISINADHILGGTTIWPGTGGQTLAKQAELYVMDVDSKEMLWQKAVIPGVKEYSDLCMAGNGLVYGIADRRQFFVFDTIARKIIKKGSVSGPIPYQQGQRIFIRGSEKIYILYADGIGWVQSQDHTIHRLASSPVAITGGGAFLNGRIYFASGSKLYSYDVQKSKDKN